MEEQALYRAILAAPHDDAPRLIYADWLDENADDFAGPLARSERGRAEFLRVQCESARLAPEGWRAGARPFAAPVSKRERRLIFQHGRAWRRAFPAGLSSSPFDRGFLRPLRAITPQQFLVARPIAGWCVTPIPPLPDDSPVRRYVPDFDPFAACPLWDVHLYAPGWLNDPLSDHGQYGALLADVAQSPDLERVGWLKVSFFQTSVLGFLRRGNFASVETLVLNAVPFPEVLLAVTENASFRSLRYVQFGDDHAMWARGLPQYLRYLALRDKLRVANERHVPFGEMRGVLRDILRTTPLVSVEVPPPAPLPYPLPVPTPIPQWTPRPVPEATKHGCGTATLAFALWLFALVLAGVFLNSNPAPKSSPTYPTYQPLQPIHIPEYKLPEYKFPAFEPHKPLTPLTSPAEWNAEWEVLKKKYNLAEWPVPPSGPRQKPPVAPPPREVKRPADPAAASSEK
jgi:uncharacterized protein (TIGR02996 family)